MKEKRGARGGIRIIFSIWKICRELEKRGDRKGKIVMQFFGGSGRGEKGLYVCRIW